MSNLKPTAKIAVNKSVVPAGTNVYLKSGQEFEIELFNPTQDNVLAKIYINGESISDTGLIIKPGRREWLERYIDKPRKFKFDVYEVEANNSDVKAAIKDNGSIRIEFYKEKKKSSSINPYLINDGNWVLPNQPYVQPYVYPSNQPYWSNGDPNFIINYDNKIDLSGNIGTTCNYVHVSDSKISEPGVLSTSNFFASDDMLNISTKSMNSKLEETGRIEAGNNSKQAFIYVDMDFETWSITSYEYKLLPLSKKPIIVSQINVYCTSCGAKQKKTSHKFCPICGTKYE